MDFAEALKNFNEVLRLDPNDPPTKNVYVPRCQVFIENPPPQPWDGVFTMTSK